MPQPTARVPEAAEAVPAGSPGAARQTLETLTGLLLEHARNPVTPMPAHFPELFTALLPRLPLAERAEIALRLAHCPALPAAVTALLVADAIEVAGPVLRQSPLLDETTLLAAARSEDGRRARCVAARSGLTRDVERALASRRELAVAEEMLGGPAHPIDSELADLLAKTPGLSPQASERLVTWGDPGLAALAQLFWSADAQTRRVILERAARQDAGRAAPPPDEAAREASLELGTRLFAAAATQRPGEMAQLLGAALSLPRSLAQQLVDDPTGEGLLVAARAAGVGVSQVTSLLILMPATGTAHDRHENLRQLALVAEHLKPWTAASLLSRWSAQAAPAPSHRPAVTAAVGPRGRAEAARPVAEHAGGLASARR